MQELSPLVLNPPMNTTLICDLSGLENLKDFFARTKDGDGVLGWDIETDPKKDFFWRRCRTIQFGHLKEQYVIDLLHFCDNDPQLLFDAQGGYGKNLSKAPKLREMLDVLKPVVCSKDFLKVGVNLGFEYMSFYWLFGQRTFNFFDCSVVEKCIWAGAHSLKDYGFFGMEEMGARYFRVQIDKQYQTSFTLNEPLTPEQIAYAALDTRFPIGLKAAQTLILQGQTAKGLQAKGNAAWKTLNNIDPLVTSDNLLEIAKIENDVVGAFQDMHIHGERIDRVKWFARTAAKKAELKALISDVLDPIFLPIVGSKTDIATDEEIEATQQKWKAFNNVSNEELALKAAIRAAKKNDPLSVIGLETQMEALIAGRKAEKEHWKHIASEMSKKRTKAKNLAAKCEGEALINYGSDAQLLAILKTMKGLAKLTSLDDEVLEKYKHIAVMVAIRTYHGLAKEIGTYGDQWALEWLTKPCKDEGWLHPGDGRLHCVFNQYDAETGRSSSEKPNGQNLPQDKDIRSCFIADAPNENIRVSKCCEADTYIDHSMGGDTHRCAKCEQYCDTHAEEYVIITADMSGAELRIIAELAHDPVWIGAFDRGEDVHSVCTELLYGEDWSKLTEPGCVYYELNDKGEPKHLKCKCKGHNELRNDTKSVNFLLAYGGGAHTLAARIGKSVEQAKVLLATHEAKFPKIWSYLEKSGRAAKIRKKSFDMFGRRRLFPEPSQERAAEKAKSDREEKMRLDELEGQKNVEAFITANMRKPTPDEVWVLTHRQPSQREISNAMVALASSIERQGKNHSIQGTNATIAKLAMGCGFDEEGKPYLWHTLPTFRAMLIKFVHDELVIQAPKQFSKQVAHAVQDAFLRAARAKMKKVFMESEYGIATYWKK
jgi:DNA polymerase I-like protein with 3'-5' exonuclease and polymerase domains